MEKINNMFAANINPADLTPMERQVLFIDDINEISFENIERIRQFIRRAKTTISARTTNVAEQLHASIEPLNAANSKAERPTERRPTINTNPRWTIDEEDEQDVIRMEPRRRPD